MTTKDDGGPFPYEPTCTHGISLRDWFAGQALAGLCTKLGAAQDEHFLRLRVVDSYRLADAMLAERAK